MAVRVRVVVALRVMVPVVVVPGPRVRAVDREHKCGGGGGEAKETAKCFKAFSRVQLKLPRLEWWGRPGTRDRLPDCRPRMPHG